jgi:NADH-quinone oxidoreductase subunit L
MEGPTPASGLIYAATIVTADVFLMVRFFPLLEYTPFALFTLTLFGSVTALFAAMAEAFQNS